VSVRLSVPPHGTERIAVTFLTLDVTKFVSTYRFWLEPEENVDTSHEDVPSPSPVFKTETDSLLFKAEKTVFIHICT
jgi:hypothetical protein